MTTPVAPQYAAIMAYEVTLDARGRLVIPKAVRDRLRLSPGATRHLTEREGALVLSPERPVARLLERGGFLVLDLGRAEVGEVAHHDARDERLRALVP